jgi:hypothetical protein
MREDRASKSRSLGSPVCSAMPRERAEEIPHVSGACQRGFAPHVNTTEIKTTDPQTSTGTGAKKAVAGNGAGEQSLCLLSIQ